MTGAFSPRSALSTFGKGVWLCVLCGLCGLDSGAQGSLAVETVRIGVLKNGAYEVVTVPLETYVARVLVGEALPGSEPAALDALAIAIRTYTLGNLSKHRADGFDLCDQTHCQVMRTSTPVTENAALRTAGQALLYNGAPATVFYSASCGGRTEKPSNVWPGAADLPYLTSHPDEGCGGAPVWSTELTVPDLTRALAAAGYRGALRDVRVTLRNESGRASEIALDGLTPAVIAGPDFRTAIIRTLGSQYLQSTVFDLTRTRTGFRFAGRGAGHGVGMCVIGSTKLAAAGESSAQILSRYFPGTTISRLTSASPSLRPETTSSRGLPVPVPAEPPAAVAAASAAATRATMPRPVGVDVAIVLPAGDEGERAAIAALVGQARADVAAALGVPAPGRVAVRFHQTVQEYERTTGQPWFTLGAVSGAELQFVPLATLRDRGMLDRAIKRQLVHLVVDKDLAERRAWVREGAALFFSEETRTSATHAVCPDDAEILKPASVGALNDAYTRARSCFERQMMPGRNWRDVR